jgi:hypothetical protein
MSQSSSPSTSGALFDAALQDYEEKTGSNLINHPLTKELQECDSVGSIIVILEEQVRIFREFRDNGKLVDSLKHLVDVLSSPFIGTVFEQGTDLLVRSKNILRCILLLIVSTANSACESNIFWHRHPASRISLILLFRLHISLTSESRRQSKMSVLAMMRS